MYGQSDRECPNMRAGAIFRRTNAGLWRKMCTFAARFASAWRSGVYAAIRTWHPVRRNHCLGRGQKPITTTVSSRQTQ